MPIYASKPKVEYSTAPEGLFTAVCIDVIDLGIVESGFGPAHKVRIKWAIDEKDEKGRYFFVSQSYRLSLHEKSNLYKILVAWRGKKFTTEELEQFDLERLIGAPAQIQVQHNLTDSGTYANVVAVVPAARGAVKMSVPSDYVREAERERRAQLEKEPDAFSNGNGYKATEEDVPF